MENEFTRGHTHGSGCPSLSRFLSPPRRRPPLALGRFVTARRSLLLAARPRVPSVNNDDHEAGTITGEDRPSDADHVWTRESADIAPLSSGPTNIMAHSRRP